MNPDCLVEDCTKEGVIPIEFHSLKGVTTTEYALCLTHAEEWHEEVPQTT